MKLVVIDYGVGNLASIKNILKRIGVDSVISSSKNELLAADKIILPGVGAFDTCARQLNESGLLPSLLKKVLKDKVPVLGVCVGMQIMLDGSEEGVLPGLGWIKGRVIKFNSNNLPAHYKIPHMGWSDVTVKRPSRLMENIVDPRFYFVHSYHAKVVNADDAILTANYGHPFIAGIEHENIVGVQFHPEKSHSFGMRLLQNFVSKY